MHGGPLRDPPCIIKYYKNLFMKLNVTYLSQYLDIEDKMDAVTSCGMACVKMLLDYYNVANDSLENLIRKGKAEGGYGPSGWIHDYFVNLLNTYNLNSYRKEKMDTQLGLEEVVDSIKNKNAVICSVAKRLFDKRVYHMILLIGYRVSDSGGLEGFYYHNPESTSREAGRDCYVSTGDFVEYWRHMAIFAKPKN